MNLNHLKFVLTVAKLGSFTEASKTCCVSQPSLSAGIRQVEEKLGSKIFERTTRSVSLTSFGRHILPSIQQVVDAERELEESAAQFFDPAHKLLAIGFSPLADMRIINAIINPFLEQNTEVTTFFKECFMDGLGARIEDGQVTAAIRLKLHAGFAEANKFGSLPLYSEPIYVVPRDSAVHLKGKAGPICIDELAGETFVLTPNGCGHAPATREWFEMSDTPLKEYQGQAVSYQIMQDWADLGLASAILPWSKITDKNRETARPLFFKNGAPVMATFELVWNEVRVNVAPLENFLNFIQKNAVPILSGLHLGDEQFSPV